MEKQEQFLLWPLETKQRISFMWQGLSYLTICLCFKLCIRLTNSIGCAGNASLGASPQKPLKLWPLKSVSWLVHSNTQVTPSGWGHCVNVCVAVPEEHLGPPGSLTAWSAHRQIVLHEEIAGIFWQPVKNCFCTSSSLVFNETPRQHSCC
jgi:hypothetical protein